MTATLYGSVSLKGYPSPYIRKRTGPEKSAFYDSLIFSSASLWGHLRVQVLSFDIDSSANLLSHCPPNLQSTVYFSPGPPALSTHERVTVWGIGSFHNSLVTASASWRRRLLSRLLLLHFLL